MRCLVCHSWNGGRLNDRHFWDTVIRGQKPLQKTYNYCNSVTVFSGMSMSYACLSVVTKLSGEYRICKRGGARSSAAGASIEAQCPSPENFLTLDLKMSTSSGFCALFLQFSYLLYKQETLLLGLQNMLLQPACNAQHRDSKRRQTQVCWKVESFYKQPL